MVCARAEEPNSRAGPRFRPASIRQLSHLPTGGFFTGALAGARIPRELAHSIPVLREIFLNLLIVIMIYVAYWVERLSNWNNAAFDCIHEFHLCHSSCRLDLNSKVLSPGVTSLFMLLQNFIGRLVFAYLVLHKLPYMHACILCTDVKRQIPANHNTNMFLLRPTNTGKNCTNCESR